MKLPENTEHEWAIWALVTVEIEGKKYAILQKRAENDSFPGCLQVTVHGGLKKTWEMKVGANRAERESMVDWLKREAGEEIIEIIQRSNHQEEIDTPCRAGIHEFFAAITDWSQQINSKGVLTIGRKTKISTTVGEKSVRKTDVTLGFDINSSNTEEFTLLIPQIQQLSRDWVIFLLSVDDMDKLIPLDPKIHKIHGVQEEGKYGMFEDEIEAVKKALK